MDDWYVTRATLDSIASQPLEHASGGLILKIAMGNAERRVAEFLSAQYGHRADGNIITWVRNHLLEQGMVVAYWAFRTPECAPSTQGDVYRVSPRKSFILFEDPNITPGVLIATTDDDLNPRKMRANPTPPETLRTGAVIRCDRGDTCQIYETGIAWGYSPERGERVLTDPFANRLYEVAASDSERIEIARRLQERVNNAVSVQLRWSNVVLNPGFAVGSATVSGTADPDRGTPPPAERCDESLLAFDNSIRDIVHLHTGNQLACLPRRDIERFWVSEYTGFESIARHPVGTAIIRSRYPTYSPCDIGYTASRNVTHSGWYFRRSNATCLNVTAFNVAAASVAIGRTPYNRAVWLYLRTIFHEQAHRAEAQAGEWYDGRWDYDEFGRAVAVQSESGADGLGEWVADALLTEDAERVTGAVAADLDARVGIAGECRDIRWMRTVVASYPGYSVRFEGANPEQGVLYGVIERSVTEDRPLYDEVLSIANHPEIVPYDRDTVIVLVEVGSWLEDDYRRYRPAGLDGGGESERPDLMPNPVDAPLRGRKRGPGSRWGFFKDAYRR